jgi:hypothetical protein
MTDWTAVAEDSQTARLPSGLDQEQVVDTMIELTRLSKLHRAICKIDLCR